MPNFSAAAVLPIFILITFTVFIGISTFYLKEAITLQHGVGFVIIAVGAGIVFRP